VKTGVIFLISKNFSREQANNASLLFLSINVGMILSALDSGKIFYNRFFSEIDYKEKKECISSYIVRILIGVCLGWIGIIIILNRSMVEPYIIILSLFWLLFDRTFDEIQRFYISKKEYSKWSKLQIIKALIIIIMCPLLMLSGKYLPSLIVTLIFFIPGFLVFLFYIIKNKQLLINVFERIHVKIMSAGIRSFKEVKIMLTGLLGTSLTLPKNIVLLYSADALINESHNILNICALQSFYIFGFYIIDKRWKILQDKESVQIINSQLFFHLVLTFVPIILITLFCIRINILSLEILSFLPLLLLSECLFNINGIQREILYYKKKDNKLLRTDCFVLGVFFIIFALVFIFKNKFFIGLAAIITVELIRAYLYKNEFSK